MNNHFDQLDWLATNRFTLNGSETIYIAFGNYSENTLNKIDKKIPDFDQL